MRNRQTKWLVGFLLSLFLALRAAPVVSQPQTVQLAQPTPVQTLVEQGRRSYAGGQLSEAIAHWQQALGIYSEHDDELHQAMVLSYLALTYQHLGDWSEARALITRAFEHLTTAASLDDTSERSPILAQALTIQGQLDFLQGHLESALVAWQQATALYQQLQDSVGTQGSLLNQAQALEVLGFHRRACQTVLEAIAFNSTCTVQTLQTIEPILQRFDAQPDANIKLLGLRSFGNVLRLLGYLPQSEQVLEHSLTLAQQLNPEETGMMQLSLADTQQALYRQAADVYERTQLESDRQIVNSLAQQALNTYQDAIRSLALLPSASTPFFQAQVQNFKLLLDWQQWSEQYHSEQYSATVNLQAQIQAQLDTLLTLQQDTLAANRATIYAQLQLARSLLQANSPQVWIDQALHTVELALKRADRLQDTQAKSYAQGTLGYLYETLAAQNQPALLAQAQTLTESALMLAQSAQSWEIAYQWQWQLGRIHRAKEDLEQAIAYYQLAVDTLDTVRRDLVDVNADVQFSFRDDVEPVYREFVQLLLTQEQSEPNQDVLKHVIKQIDALRVSELENFLRCNLRQAIAINEESIDPTAALIYPIILKEQLAIILKLPQTEQLYLHTISRSQTAIDDTVEQLRIELERPYRSPEGLALSQQLYRWLIQPIEAKLNDYQIKTIVFVPDGSLRNIPMAALHDGQHYLIENYAVAINPSLELLKPEPISQTPLRVLSFGLSETRQNFPPHQGFAALTNVEAELDTIKARFPNQTRLNEAFTSSALQDLVRSVPFPVIHLATHGQFSSTPQDTFILAWDRRININDLSTILQDRDQSTSNPIQLLVLSACKTADGDRRAALGLAGVAVQSGARSTIASLWAVNDRATAELMGLLYQALSDRQASLTKAEALRRAQIALLQTEGYRAPVYWAPYILLGNWL